LRLNDLASADAAKLKVSDTDKLMQPGLGLERYLKINGEWMAYRIQDVDWEKGEVRVRRGQRGTTKASHPSGSWIYIGSPSSLQMRLPVYRDRYVIREERR
jgi:hypothetical protein